MIFRGDPTMLLRGLMGGGAGGALSVSTTPRAAVGPAPVQYPRVDRVAYNVPGNMIPPPSAGGNDFSTRPTIPKEGEMVPVESNWSTSAGWSTSASNGNSLTTSSGTSSGGPGASDPDVQDPENTDGQPSPGDAGATPGTAAMSPEVPAPPAQVQPELPMAPLPGSSAAPQVNVIAKPWKKWLLWGGLLGLTAVGTYYVVRKRR